MHSPGSIIGGKYRLVQQIGEGGMATVWRAIHTTLNREVAVKFIEMRGPNADKHAARFLDEARIAAAVRHRNVVDIIDFGTTPEGSPYMVMEFLDGESLADRMSRTPALSIPEVVSLVSLSLSGLGAVHDKGIVHRDLKPENIFLVNDADGSFPKLLDFGISKSVEGQVKGKRAAALTQEGTLLGTPQYMSPEQARGMKDVDKRTDIYSMGVILYEALTGHLPFDSENLGDLLLMVIQDEYDPAFIHRPEIGPHISSVVDRALSKNRDERFQDAREFRTALLEAAGVPTEVSGLYQMTTSGAFPVVGGSGLHRPPNLTPQAMPAVAGARQRSATPMSSSRVHAPAPTPELDVEVGLAETIPPPSENDVTTTAPVPVVPMKTFGKPDLTPTPAPMPKPGATPFDAAVMRPDTPTRNPLPPTPNAWDDVVPMPPRRSKVPVLLAVLVLLLAAGGIAVMRPGWLGLERSPLAGFGIGEGGSGGGAIDSPDAGTDAGVDAGVPMVSLRLLEVPEDAIVVLDDWPTLSGEMLREKRGPDGAVVLDIERRRAPFELMVTAPNRTRWRARRWATRDWEWTVRLEVLDAGPPDAGPSVDAGPTTRPAAKIRRPIKRTKIRRRGR